MKTKDLVYIGIIGYLAFLLLKKKPKSSVSGSTSNLNIPPVGNATNGGLNLGTNMDLPNLTPTSPDGLPTELALGSSNISPLIKDDNEPTQIFGGVSLPTPYISSSIVNPNPIDVVSPPQIPNLPVVATEPVNTPQPISISEPITSSPVSSATSLIAEPVFPIKTISAQLITNKPDLGEEIPLSYNIKNELLSCGKSFSIPNNDKEGSYTNFWTDGDGFFTQTTSPLIKTIPTKISMEAFIEGCKKLQLIQIKNGKA